VAVKAAGSPGRRIPGARGGADAWTVRVRLLARPLVLAGAAALVTVAGAAPAAAPAPARASAFVRPAPPRAPQDMVPGTSCPVFPADNIWHADVAHLPVAAQSAQWLAATGAGSGTRLHPDFGPSYGAQPVPYGIGFTVVTSAHPTVPVSFLYADESDPVRYPLGTDTFIEGGPNATGDRHAIEVNATTCELYETWDTVHTPTGWTAGSGAVWNLRSDALRPAGWTSADAAGLPILAGLLRYDEVASGYVDHAIRFTVHATSGAYLWPARHVAGSTAGAPPMGARFRLKASFSLAGYSPQAQVVLRAMQTYGLIVADNGSNWFFQGTADTRWPQGLLTELESVPASAFEAVDTASLQVSANSGQAR